MKKPTNTETSKLLEQAWKKFKKKDFAGAEKVFSGILEQEETHKEALMGLSGSLMRRKEYLPALEVLDKMEELDPKESKIYHLMGLCNGGDENYEQCIEDLEKAIELSDDKFEAYFDLGGTYLVTKDYIKAAQCFEKCITLDGTCCEAWTGKALVAYYNREHKASLEYLNIALKLNSKYLLALLLKLEIFVELGKQTDAGKELKKVLALKPDIFKITHREEDNEMDDDTDVDEDANRSEDDEIEEFDLDD